jgi:hypothetical protein
MAKDKTSFILYSDLIGVVKKLVLKDREEGTNYAGELFLHILEYVNDNNPIPINFIVDMAFEPIKLALKRDLVKYEIYINKQKENGSKGGRPKKETQETQPFLEKPKKADSVSDSVIDSDNEILLKKEPKINKFDFRKDLMNYGFDENLVNDWLLVRKNKKATNTETSFNSFIKEIEKRNCDLNEILEFIVTKNWSGFKWNWYDSEIQKEKGSAEKEKEKPMIGRMTQESVEKTFNAFLNVEANG